MFVEIDEASVKFLILNHNLKILAGSEINAVQLCLALRGLGHEADLGTFLYDFPLKKIVVKNDLKVIDLLSDDADPAFDYDVIWAHHAPVLSHLLFKKEVPDCRILFSSLSPILPLEAPPIFLDSIQLYLSHSPDNRDLMKQHGVPAESIHYFPNFAPDKYFVQPPREFPATPRKIAVISNHPPEEIRAFARIAAKADIAVDLIGKKDRPVFVDDVLLRKYDLVVSIGKTVVYCFVLSIPVYCYDHFGGPGYITPANFHKAKTHNFSGRGFDRRLGPENLFHEIVGHYGGHQKNLPFLFTESSRHFCLEKNLEDLFRRISQLPLLNIQEFRKRNSLAERAYDVYIEILLKSRKKKTRNMRKRILKFPFEYWLSKIKHLSKQIIGKS